jgi:hypothetical protein
MPVEPLVSLSTGRPTLDVSVVMRLEPVAGPMARWQPWRWVVHDVVPEAAPQAVLPGAPAQRLPEPEEVRPVAPGDGEPLPSGRFWLHRGHRVELYRDDAEGHYLNLTSPTPCFWVFWRPDDGIRVEGEAFAVPQIVTLSYHDAGRWLDAQEKVDQVPAPAVVVDWLRDFVDAHYQVEPKRRKRPQSFQPLTDRFGQPVRISTDKQPSRRGPDAGRPPD